MKITLLFACLCCMLGAIISCISENIYTLLLNLGVLIYNALMYKEIN